MHRMASEALEHDLLLSSLRLQENTQPFPGSQMASRPHFMQSSGSYSGSRSGTDGEAEGEEAKTGCAGLGVKGAGTVNKGKGKGRNGGGFCEKQGEQGGTGSEQGTAGSDGDAGSGNRSSLNEKRGSDKGSGTQVSWPLASSSSYRSAAVLCS